MEATNAEAMMFSLMSKCVAAHRNSQNRGTDVQAKRIFVSRYLTHLTTIGSNSKRLRCQTARALGVY